MGLSIVLQPSLTTVEAITTMKKQGHPIVSEESKHRTKKLSTRDSILPDGSDSVAKESQESSDSDVSESNQTSGTQSSESDEATVTETTPITSSTSTSSSESEKETTESQTETTKESESESNKTTEKEKESSSSSSKSTEDEFDKLEKENEKARLETYAKYPERPTIDILNSVPSDIVSLDGVFDAETAGAISSNTSHIERTASGGDVVFMTDSEIAHEGGQSSALWSYQGAKVNMKKPFETEMYVYLGNSRLGAADGMTVTFHNDKRQTASIGQPGGALGAYGDVDTKRKPSKGSTGWGKPNYGDTMDKFIQEGVQESFSIEMDTNANAIFDAGEGFSGFSKRQHIMLSYPAHTKFAAFNKEKFIGLINTGRWTKKESIPQFGMKETGWFSNTYRPYIYNNAVGKPLYQSSDGGFLGGNSYLADGKWHTLKIQYTPKDRKSANKGVKVDAPEFKVTFDGKTRDYTGRFAPFQNGLVTEEDPYMYWGMTAATGATASTQAVAFKNIPKTAGIDHTSDIKQDGKTIIDMEAEDYTHVKSGDELSYETFSHYATGDAEFQDPIFIETLNKNVEVIPGSFEVMENGSTEFVTVPEGDYTTDKGVVTYRLSKNLSLLNPDFKTRFKVKVKPTYYETLVTEESQIATATEHITSTEDLSYIIDPLSVDGEVVLEQLTDNPEITQKVKGKVVLNKDYANQTVSVKLDGDKEVADLAEVDVTLDAKGQGTFEVPFENYLTADNVITGTAANKEKDVVAVGKGQVIDKTAPTADKEPMDYFVLSKEPSKLPFEALQLLTNIEDTNPSLETTDGEDPDMMARFLNEKAIKKGLTKIGTFDAEIELKDRFDNKRTIVVPVNVVKSRLMINVIDSQVYLADIANRKNGQSELKEEAEVMAVLEEKSEIQVSYIELNGSKTPLEAEDFEQEGNSYEISGDIKPAVGVYPLTLAVTYNIYDDGAEKPVKVSDAKDFTLTVIDGHLSISGEGDLAAETKITTKVEDISLKEAVKIQVSNTNFETDSWRLEAKAEPFANSKEQTGFPLSLIYFDQKNKTELDLNAGAVQIDESTDRQKNFTFTEMGDNNYFKLRTATSSSNWATVDETYRTTINWNLVGSSTSALKISDQLTEKGR